MNKGRLVRAENKAVNLAVVAYDGQPAGVGPAGAVYVFDARVHPLDERAKARVDLSLDVKPDARAADGKNRLTVCTEEEMKAIQSAAGENHVAIRSHDGQHRGHIYGVSADLRSSNISGTPGTQSLYLESVKPSELSVTTDDAGVSILDRLDQFKGRTNGPRTKAVPQNLRERFVAEAPQDSLDTQNDDEESEMDVRALAAFARAKEKLTARTMGIGSRSLSREPGMSR